MDGKLRFRWLGVQGIELEADGHVLMIDPFVTRPAFRYLFFGRPSPNRDLIIEKLPRCDDVLVSHTHWDHAMDVPDLLRHTGATAWGSPNTCALLKVSGISPKRIREIKVGNELALGPFWVKVCAAEHTPLPFFPLSGTLRADIHPPLRLRDYLMDDCFSFMISVHKRRLAYCPAHGQPTDVLLTGIHNRRAEVASLLRNAQPKLIIPLHWDNLFRPLSRPIRGLARSSTRLRHFAQLVTETLPQCQVLIPEIFRTYDLLDFDLKEVR